MIQTQISLFEDEPLRAEFLTREMFYQNSAGSPPQLERGDVVYCVDGWAPNQTIYSRKLPAPGEIWVVESNTGGYEGVNVAPIKSANPARESVYCYSWRFRQLLPEYKARFNNSL